MSITEITSYKQEARVDWQTAHAYTCGGKDGICYSRGERRHTRLAHAAGRLGAGHDVNFYIWRLVHSQHLKVVKIALFHGAIFDHDLAAEYGSQSKVDGAFRHGADAVWIDGCAAIDSRNDPTHAYSKIFVERDLRHVRDVAAK